MGDSKRRVATVAELREAYKGLEEDLRAAEKAQVKLVDKLKEVDRGGAAALEETVKVLRADYEVLRVGYNEHYDAFKADLEAARGEATRTLLRMDNEVDLRFGDFTNAIAGSYQRKRPIYDAALVVAVICCSLATGCLAWTMLN